MEQLYHYVLNFFKDNLIDQGRCVKICLILSLNLKGLTKEEILNLSGATMKEFSIVLIHFNSIIIFYRIYFIMNDEFMKEKIKSLYAQANSSGFNEIHEEIATELDRTAHSIRKLEEISFQLFMSKSYFKLKESVANIENFLLLFNPNTKYDLYQFWQRLEEKGYYSIR